MSQQTDRDFLSDIQEAIRRIMEYTAGMTYQAFVEERLRGRWIQNHSEG